MLITREVIDSLKSDRGGWTRKSLAKLGVTWPARRGWKKRIIGKEMKEGPSQAIQDIPLRTRWVIQQQIPKENSMYAEDESRWIDVLWCQSFESAKERYDESIKIENQWPTRILKVTEEIVITCGTIFV